MSSHLLSHLGVLRISGKDALTFLQGQITHDTRRLAEQQTLLAACANVQGRVLAVLHLMPHTEGILAVVPRELTAGLITHLRRFVLRAKVQLTDLTDTWAVAGFHDAAALAQAGLPAPQGGATYLEQAGIGIARVSERAERSFAVGPRTAVEQFPPSSTIGELLWRLADVRDGLPQIYAATRELFVPQMLNLDLIDGISFSKGCYTGQEIIARTQHLGRIKRRMFRLGLPRPVAIGAPLTLKDGRAGRVVECVSLAEHGAPGAPDAGHAEQHCEALAVLSLEPGPAEADATGAALTAVELALPYALRSES
jgi:folate-binding protein YgfZ